MKVLLVCITAILSVILFETASAQISNSQDTSSTKLTTGDKLNDSLISNDSTSREAVQELNSKLAEIESLRVNDSLRKSDLERQLNSLKTTDNLRKEELLKQIEEIEKDKLNRIALRKSKIDSLRNFIKGYPVTGPFYDTLFYVYSRLGASTPKDRATNITKKIKQLYDDDFLKIDSIILIPTDNLIDITYGETIIMSITESDALWNDTNIEDLSTDYLNKVKSTIASARDEGSLTKLLTRIGLAIAVILLTWLMIRLIGKGVGYLSAIVESKKDIWLKELKYSDYTILDVEQELSILRNVLKVLKLLLYIILLYLAFPLIFSIFPFTRNWADKLFALIWQPFKGILNSIVSYLPNVFTILVIVVVMIYLKRLVRYIFSEIDSGRLKINGFYSDWAMPTFSIVKFLLYAFTFVLIFPYLPGSDSDIFKGVSVFIGLLFSLGSTSAISNMVAGLVITYMRPFKIGEMIKMGDVTGRVIEKNLLVTRVMTIKNEMITVPNSTILTGNTMNFSVAAEDSGLILHTSVTIGYDAPWKDVHSALIEAADRTEFILKDPKPFVLQTSLDDFYVSYQLNAYTRNALTQAPIYSSLHQNIQDVFNERGIEIMSPHYRAERDGNSTTIPASYLPPDYKAPGFKIDIDDSRKKKGEDGN